jgi:hypothetical protein
MASELDKWFSLQKGFERHESSSSKALIKLIAANVPPENEIDTRIFRAFQCSFTKIATIPDQEPLQAAGSHGNLNNRLDVAEIMVAECNSTFVG